MLGGVLLVVGCGSEDPDTASYMGGDWPGGPATAYTLGEPMDPPDPSVWPGWSEPVVDWVLRRTVPAGTPDALALGEPVTYDEARFLPGAAVGELVRVDSQLHIRAIGHARRRPVGLDFSRQAWWRDSPERIAAQAGIAPRVDPTASSTSLDVSVGFELGGGWSADVGYSHLLPSEDLVQFESTQVETERAGLFQIKREF